MPIRHLFALFTGLALIVGCPSGDDDDLSGDDDASIDDDDDSSNCDAAEPCVGDYVIENGSDLDTLSTCESVSGDLVLTGSDWLTTFDQLACLTTVKGEFRIQDNGSLASIDLPRLVAVEWMRIGGNVGLTTIDLPSLTTGCDGLDVEFNDSLANLDGLANITTLGERLYIQNNASLFSLDGLSSLTTVDGSLVISTNAILPDLGGLASLESVGALSIEGNDSLARINPPLLRSVDGGLDVRSNDSLSAFDMPSLESVGGDVLIEFNACLSQTDAEDFTASIDVGGGVGVYDNGDNYPCP